MHHGVMAGEHNMHHKKQQDIHAMINIILHVHVHIVLRYIPWVVR